MAENGGIYEQPSGTPSSRIFASHTPDADIETQKPTNFQTIGVRSEDGSGGSDHRAQQDTSSRTSETKNSDNTEDAPPIQTLRLTDLDRGIVGWDSQDDAEMPLNFVSSRKWLTVGVLSFLTFIILFTSAILAPSITYIAKEYDERSLTKASMPVSIYILGYAVGPLLLSPLSEIHGRYVILVASNASFCAWLLACALAPSLNTLIFFRFMAGASGSSCQTVGGGVISDMFPVTRRGRAMAIWTTPPMFGPSIGPLIGGYVSQTIGWRWVNWIAFIPATIAVILLFFFSQETNPTVLMQRKTDKLRKEMGRDDLRSCYINVDAPVLSKQRIISNGLIRPVKMLFQSAIIFSVSLYIAFTYGCLYLLLNTIPFVFQEKYGWSVGTAGLVYLTIMIGYCIGMAAFGYMSDRTLVRMTAANGGVTEPEMRLPDCIWFALVLPITFFWYGWSANAEIFWLVPVIGLIPFGIALIGVWLPIQTYIVDAYPQYAASGLAAFGILRNVVAAFLPLAGPQMYASLGVGWGTSILGFIAIAMIPVPTLVYTYGAQMRKRFPLHL